MNSHPRPDGQSRPALLAPSILSADFARLGDEVAAVEAAGADWIHVDVMDGHFVPNITIGIPVVRSLRKVTRLPLDTHLMITNADRFAVQFVEAGSDRVSVHVEACPHLHRTVQEIREAGAKAGVVLNPATPLDFIDPILSDVDYVLLMTVNPGFGGQRFIPSVLDKVRTLRSRIVERGLDIDIQVDGGIAENTIGLARAAGANVFVAGSAIFGSAEYGETMRALKRETQRVDLAGLSRV
jgi:ribulose-phosphate 3-epimerase